MIPEQVRFAQQLKKVPQERSARRPIAARLVPATASRLAITLGLCLATIFLGAGEASPLHAQAKSSERRSAEKKNAHADEARPISSAQRHRHATRQIRNTQQLAMRLLDQARQRRDIVTVMCLDQSLSETNMLSRSHDQTLAKLEEARGETARRLHRLVDIEKARADALRKRALQCVGIDQNGATEVTVVRED